jgi:tetratricopeptide (TPR) repeat protein
MRAVAKKIKIKTGWQTFTPRVPSVPKPAQPASAQREAALDLHEYTLARMIENSDQLGNLDAATRNKLRAKWTPDKVDALATNEILDKLRGMGVAIDERTLRELSAGRRSACELSHEVHPELNGDDSDFVALAFCALWKRWMPDRPSVEMIDDWIRDGYACVKAVRHEEALRSWRSAWDALREQLDSTVTTLDAAERAMFSGLQSLRNWTQDYVTEHLNAPAQADEGVRFVDELLAQFTNEEKSYRRDFMLDKASILENAGRIDEALRAAEAVIAAWPRDAVGYAVVADIAEEAQRNDVAIAALERALAARADDAGDFDIEGRLSELRASR